jgi:hypothetical protein
MIRDFYTPTLVHGIMIEVDIGAFVETVVWGFVRGWGEVVVDVRKAV